MSCNLTSANIEKRESAINNGKVKIRNTDTKQVICEAHRQNDLYTGCPILNLTVLYLVNR